VRSMVTVLLWRFVWMGLRLVVSVACALHFFLLFFLWREHDSLASGQRILARGQGSCSLFSWLESKFKGLHCRPGLFDRSFPRRPLPSPPPHHPSAWRGRHLPTGGHRRPWFLPSTSYFGKQKAFYLVPCMRFLSWGLI
jgi:hypothetical protein